MKKNVGSADKGIRIILGLVLLILAFTVPAGQPAKVVFIVVGIIALLTAITGFCPLYTLLGINTRKVKSKDKDSE